MTSPLDQDQGMSRVASLAARLAGTSMALVVVADGDRARVIGAHGLGDATPLRTLDPWPAVGQAINVQDLSLDARFADHPVTALGARSLVARPVRLPGDTSPVGAVVVMDGGITSPLLDEGQQGALDDLATLVGERLQLGRVRARTVAAEAEALATSAAKQRVTSRLSHDLRTPMTAILGFGQLLRLEALTENGVESVDHLLAAARKLLGMIDEVLDLNRLDQGEHEVALETLSLADVLHVAQVAARKDAERRQADVVIDPSCDALNVRSDRRRLQQVVVSLVGNVLERSGGGAVVRVAATVTAGRVRVTVADDRQVAQGGGASGDGTRDGLTLSKRLMEAMEGDVGIDPGPGRRYWLDLPLPEGFATSPGGAPASPPVAAAPVADGRGRRMVLYVEDDPANQRLVTRMFARDTDVEVVSAMDGRTGIDLARERSPDVVLLDLGLPDISGREVLASLKADSTTEGIPVVVLSGEAEADRPGELERAGAAAYVTKPFNVRAMLDLVGGLFDGRA